MHGYKPYDEKEGLGHPLFDQSFTSKIIDLHLPHQFPDLLDPCLHAK
jgi:hypothetical protein